MINNNLNHQSTHSKKPYILGRKNSKVEGLLYIGHFHALDTSLGSPVFMDILHPHICLISGKRGYGKSYTLGVLIEEISKQTPEIRRNLSTILIDTLGIFWTLAFPNTRQYDYLKQWNLDPKTFHITVFTTNIHDKPFLKSENITLKHLLIKTSQLSPLHWCQLFDIKPTDSLGIIISKAILELQHDNKNYTIDEVIKKINSNDSWNLIQKTAVENLFSTAKSWDIFSEEGMDFKELLKQNTIHVIDLSEIDNDFLKSIIVSVIADSLFYLRVQARKTMELNEMGLSKLKKYVPLIWLAIDEAQLFIPKKKTSVCKTILKDKWMRQGRQPGLSLMLATQKPSLIDPEVFSHSDLIYCHRLTADEDIQSLKRIHPTYMKDDIHHLIQKIGSDKGVALVIDDTKESVHLVKIRPRQSWHGGGNPSVLNLNI